MAEYPEAKLPNQSQPWGRSVDERITALRAENDDLRNIIARIKIPIDTTAPVFDDIYYQIDRIYTLIGSLSVPAPPPAPPATPIPTYKTIEIGADWSRTWGTSSYYTGGGTNTDSQALYQGSSPEAKIGMWHFGIGEAGGRNIIDVQMYMQNMNSPFQAGFVASFGTHGNVGAPTGKPGRQNGFDVSWGRGEGKWIGIPTWAWGGLANGSIQGFTIGGIGANNPNYAYFQGVGKAQPPRLKVTFQV